MTTESTTAESTEQQPAEQPQKGGEQQPNEGAKTFDADYVAKLRQEAAKYRTEAKTNAEAAKRLAEIEDAQKSEAQKAADRIAELEKQTAEAQRDALRFKVASKFGISDEDADLFLTASDEETLNKQAERLAAHREDAGKTRQPKPDRNQGRQSAGTTSTADQFAAAVGDLL